MRELEILILTRYNNDDAFAGKIEPYLNFDYFEQPDVRQVFQLSSKYREEYQKHPVPEVLKVGVEQLEVDNQTIIENCNKLIDQVSAPETISKIVNLPEEWILQQTQKFMTKRACYLKIMQSLSIIDGSYRGKLTEEAIPDLLREALSINFDTDIGHDYFEDSQERYEYYHRVENKIPFSIEMLNTVTNGGPTKKAIIIALAGTNVGKSLFLTDQSAHWLMEGKKVLYITMEMAEERIAERIDAKLMTMDINKLNTIPEMTFKAKIDSLQAKTDGKLIIREYPPHVFTANHLRNLLREIKQKKGFVPDIIALDYLGLCASYRLQPSVGSYAYLKSVTEEFRGVMTAGEYLGVTAMQTNRTGQSSADVDYEDMSESHGISMGADFIFAMMSPPELAQMGAYRFKQLKSRFGDVNKLTTFLVGVDKAMMTLYNMDNVQAENTAPVPSAPVKQNNKPALGNSKGRTPLKT